jgi:hypothetical protein
VDINPAVVTKLSDRGSFQTMGIVTDVESFMRELCRALGLLSNPNGLAANDDGGK